MWNEGEKFGGFLSYNSSNRKGRNEIKVKTATATTVAATLLSIETTATATAEATLLSIETTAIAKPCRTSDIRPHHQLQLCTTATTTALTQQH